MTPTTPAAVLRRGALALALVAGAGALGGCVPLVIGGAVAGGALVYTDRRTSGAQIDDEAIELKGNRRTDRVVDERGRVSVTSYNRIALLTGAVASEADRVAAERSMAGIENLRSVVNELTVGTPTTFAQRSNDTLLTSKVKASLIDAKDVQAQAFKVVTERGVVYLMGRVTETEASRATEITRGIPGVAKVVKVFEIVTPAELNAQKAQANSGSTPTTTGPSRVP